MGPGAERREKEGEQLKWISENRVPMKAFSLEGRSFIARKQRGLSWIPEEVSMTNLICTQSRLL